MVESNGIRQRQFTGNGLECLKPLWSHQLPYSRQWVFMATRPKWMITTVDLATRRSLDCIVKSHSEFERSISLSLISKFPDNLQSWERKEVQELSYVETSWDAAFVLAKRNLHLVTSGAATWGSFLESNDVMDLNIRMQALVGRPFDKGGGYHKIPNGWQTTSVLCTWSFTLDVCCSELWG